MAKSAPERKMRNRTGTDLLILLIGGAMVWSCFKAINHARRKSVSVSDIKNKIRR
jgi:hypothetical protein